MMQCAGILTFKILFNKINSEKKTNNRELCTRKRRVKFGVCFLLKHSITLLDLLVKEIKHLAFYRSCFKLSCN